MFKFSIVPKSTLRPAALACDPRGLARFGGPSRKGSIAAKQRWENRRQKAYDDLGEAFNDSLNQEIFHLEDDEEEAFHNELQAAFEAEAVRKIVRASFAHNKSNVISPAFASHSLRHESRFHMSHEFKFCPLQDLTRMLNGQSVQCGVQLDSGRSHFECQAPHYLCRHNDLEDCSLKEFIENYKVCCVPKKKHKDQVATACCDVWPFIPDAGCCKHPSTFKGECRQGVKEEESDFLVKINQWCFPDTATFKCNVVTCTEVQMNGAAETYAQMVLALLMPFRSLEDLRGATTGRYPCTKRLQ